MKNQYRLKSLKLLVSVKDHKISASDGYVYPLRNRFLYLYFYLALKRKEDPMNTGGIVNADEILLVPYWERNNIDSVGKQIRRHILEMEKIGRNIIESQQKISGPFRLIPTANQINVDVPLYRIKDKLDLIHVSKLDKKQEAKFYKVVEYIWEGNTKFDDGLLEEAMSLFKQASKSAVNLKLEVAALQKMGRTLDRLGDMEKARLIYQKILKFKKLDERELSSTYVLFALLKYRTGYLDEAEKLFYKASDIVRGKKYYNIIGGVYNGLGLIRKEREHYPEAIAFYQRALEYWSLVDFFYGIQAVYFNIGNLYKIWGDKLSKHQKSLKISKYNMAIKWVMRCRSLCFKTGIAYETSQDHILLAELHLTIGHPNKALEFANTANEMAQTAGNKTDIANSYRILGYTYLEMGIKEKARASFKSGIDYLKKLGVSKIVIKEKEQKIIKLLK